MTEEINIMLKATAQLDAGEKKTIFIPVRASEYRELVELATTYKMRYEAANDGYWKAQSEILKLEAQLREIKEAAK